MPPMIVQHLWAGDSPERFSRCKFRKAFQPEFGAHQGLARVLKSLSNPQNCRNQERKSSPKKKFSARISRGHPGVIRADIPAQNFGHGPPNPGKNKHFGADIHDPKARTSTTLRHFQKLWSEKLRAEFSFPKKGAESPGKGHSHSLRQTVCTKPWFKRDLKILQACASAMFALFCRLVTVSLHEFPQFLTRLIHF